MKKTATIVFLLICCTRLSAQTDLSRLGTDIRKLGGEYNNDFANIKGGLKSDSQSEAVYYSRMKMTGSIDSSNLIHYVKDREIWSYSAEFNSALLNISYMDSVVRSINFSFGKLASIPHDTDLGTMYIPAEKKGLSEKLRCLFLFFSHGQHVDKLFFTISHDDSYRNK